jgi:hypothetical protein
LRMPILSRSFLRVNQKPKKPAIPNLKKVKEMW